jgi:hypothetical protein
VRPDTHADGLAHVQGHRGAVRTGAEPAAS